MKKKRPQGQDPIENAVRKLYLAGGVDEKREDPDPNSFFGMPQRDLWEEEPEGAFVEVEDPLQEVAEWEGGLYPDAWRQENESRLDFDSDGGISVASTVSELDPEWDVEVASPKEPQEPEVDRESESEVDREFELEWERTSATQAASERGQESAQGDSTESEGLSLNAIRQARYAHAIEREGRDSKRLWRRRYARIWKRIWGYGPLTRKLLVLSLILFLVTVTLLLPPFYVDTIRITGLHQLQGRQILEASALQPGQHMISGLGGSLEGWLRLRYTSAEKRILAAMPEVQNVRIVPVFPGGIEIQVEERIGVAYIHTDDSYLVVDREGIVLKILGQPPQGLPLIEGVSQSAARVGQSIDVGLRRDVSSAVQIVATILDTDLRAADDWDFLGRILSIRPLAQEGHLLLVRKDSGAILTVRLGSISELKDHLYWLRAVLKRHLLVDMPDGMLDLSGAFRMFRPGDAFVVTEGDVPTSSSGAQSNTDRAARVTEDEGEGGPRSSNPKGEEDSTVSTPHSSARTPAMGQNETQQPGGQQGHSNQGAGGSANAGSDSNLLPQFPKPHENESADSVLNP